MNLDVARQNGDTMIFESENGVDYRISVAASANKGPFYWTSGSPITLSENPADAEIYRIINEV